VTAFGAVPLIKPPAFRRVSDKLPGLFAQLRTPNLEACPALEPKGLLQLAISDLKSQLMQVFVTDFDALQRRDLAKILLHVEVPHAALARCRKDPLPVNSSLPHLGK